MHASATFYAWTVPAFVSGSPVDHTWVTTYDNRITVYPGDAAVAAAGPTNRRCLTPRSPHPGSSSMISALSRASRVGA